MCEFCNNQCQKIIPDEDLKFIKEMLEDGNETSAYCSVFLEDGELYFDSSSNEYPPSKIKINYCPICGRDLRSEENEQIV